MDCKACMKFRLSEDGQKLQIVHLNEDHSHCITKESFIHLPQQRRLDEQEKDAVAQMLAVKANKKMIQQHMIQSTGKMITMKDIQNANQSCLNHENDLITLLNVMRKEEGSITEVVIGEDNQLRAIYYQQRDMLKVFASYPEVLLLDATYKLNNLRMPLYVLMCVDGNGESVVVALWIVANEERETISALADIFTRHNEISGVHVVMADKDIPRRGRQEGAETTVIGLPKKRKLATLKLLPFSKIPPADKDKMLLKWLIKPDVLTTVLNEEQLIEITDIIPWLRIPTKVTDEPVEIARVRKYFSSDSWLYLSSKLALIKKGNLWLCQACDNELCGAFVICCDHCLSWFDRKCVGLKSEPKRKNWFCKGCLKNE